MALPSAHQENPDCDMWVHEYFTPSWFCLPDNRTVLTVVRPGDSARDTLEGVCKVRPWGVLGSRGPGSPRTWRCRQAGLPAGRCEQQEPSPLCGPGSFQQLPRLCEL